MALERLAEIRREADGYINEFNALVGSDVPAYNKAAVEQGVPTLFAGDPIRVAEPEL